MRKDLRFRFPTVIMTNGKSRTSPSCGSIRVVVLGARNVGKSAVTVRFLTKRFISEYSSKSDLLYQHTVTIDGDKYDLEIVDTIHFDASSPSAINSRLMMSTENVGSTSPVSPLSPTSPGTVADAYVFVYAIDDKWSFQMVSEMLYRLRFLSSTAPVLLIANKLDLSHARQVDTEDGRDLLDGQKRAFFYEVSAAESCLGVNIAFQTLLREVVSSKTFSPPPVLPLKRRLSVVTVSKMIGAVFGKTDKQKRRSSESQRSHVIEFRRPSISF